MVPPVGTITSTGLYTAPSSILTQQTVTITATSQTSASAVGTALVTLSPSASGGAFNTVTDILAEALCRQPYQAPTVTAGADQDVRCPSSGCPVGQVVLGGSGTFMARPGVTPVFRWTQLSGPAAANLTSPNTAYSQATFPVLGTYRFQLTLNDGTSVAAAETTVIIKPNLQNGFLSLNPPVNGPAQTGSSIALRARFWGNNAGFDSVPIVNSPVTFSVAGPNARTATAITDANGDAVYFISSPARRWGPIR